MSNYVDANFTKKHLQDGRTKVVNVLAKEKYQEKHVPGSINIPEDAPDFATRVQKEVPDKSTPIIVHCSSMDCQASTKAARKLESMGYTEVHDFKAGLQGWEQAGNPFEKGAAPVQQPAEAPAPVQAEHKGAERPPRPGRETSSHREDQQTAETQQH